MTEVNVANSRQGEFGGVVNQETPSTDELPPAQADEADPLVTDRDSAGRVRSTAAARALAMLPRAPRNVPRKVASHPEFAAHDVRRVDWTSKRTSELHSAHGGVSVGVGARIEMAGWLYAAAEFAAEQGALTLDKDWFVLLGRLAPSAKVLDDAAWEICAKENAGSKKRDAFQALDDRIAKETKT